MLDLTAETGGNANGIGTADFTTGRAAAKMDFGQTYPNGLTSTVVGPVSLPMILPTDRLALAAALLTCNAVGREPRLLRIANTLRLDEFAVSASLLDEVRRHPHLEVVAGPGAPAFDAAGDLLDLGDPGAALGAPGAAAPPAAAPAGADGR